METWEKEQMFHNLQKALSAELRFGELSKARSGIYEDTPENRKLGRVGQRYGEEHHEENQEVRWSDRLEHGIKVMITHRLYFKELPEDKVFKDTREYAKRHLGVYYDENQFRQVYNRLFKQAKEEWSQMGKEQSQTEERKEQSQKEQWLKELEEVRQRMKQSPFVNPQDLGRERELMSLLATEGESETAIDLPERVSWKNPRRATNFTRNRT